MSYMFSLATAFDQDLSGWDVTALNDAEGMFAFKRLSPDNYDALLIGWDAQALKSGVTFGGGDSTYCAAEAEAARAHMISADGWTITDGGKGCGLTADLAITMERTGLILVEYTLTVTNLGPDAADGARMQDILSDSFRNVTWTCTASNGAVCAHASGTGNVLDETIPTLSSGGEVVFVVRGETNPFGHDGNHASVTAPIDVVDPVLENNAVMLTDLQRFLLPVIWNNLNPQTTSTPPGSPR